MKITLEIFEKSKIVYSWKTIYTAQVYNFINQSEVKKFISISKEPNSIACELINRLELENISPEHFVEYIIENSIIKKEEILSFADIEKELNKIKYAMLSYLKNNYKRRDELPQKVADLYSDLWYPEDMEYLVYYMPFDNKKISIETPMNFEHMEYKDKLYIYMCDYLKKMKRKIDNVD